MKHILPIVMLAVDCTLLAPRIACAQVKEGAGDGAARFTAAQARGNLCAKADRVVFSCVLDGGKKSVSLCASGDGRQGQRHYHYIYGRPSAPELVFPPADEAASGVFFRTHLLFAGNTGGFAYSFVNEGYKYILYSIAGSYDYLDDGLLVQKIGDLRAVSEMKCQKASVIDSDDRDIFNETRAWPKDRDIDLMRLPQRR